jgi:hypothetical protein
MARSYGLSKCHSLASPLFQPRHLYFSPGPIACKHVLECFRGQADPSIIGRLPFSPPAFVAVGAFSVQRRRPPAQVHLNNQLKTCVIAKESWPFRTVINVAFPFTYVTGASCRILSRIQGNGQELHECRIHISGNDVHYHHLSYAM